MLKISRESEINLINVLIDNDVISGKDLINIKKTSTEGNKSQTRTRKALGFIYYGESAEINQEAHDAYQEKLRKEMKEKNLI